MSHMPSLPDDATRATFSRAVYHAQFGDVGSEHENCYVYAGRFDGKLTALGRMQPLQRSQIGVGKVRSNPGSHGLWIV